MSKIQKLSFHDFRSIVGNEHPDSVDNQYGSIYFSTEIGFIKYLLLNDKKRIIPFYIKLTFIACVVSSICLIPIILINI